MTCSNCGNGMLVQLGQGWCGACGHVQREEVPAGTAEPVSFSAVVQAAVRYVPGLEPEEGGDWCGWITDTYGPRGLGYSMEELPSMPRLWEEWQLSLLPVQGVKVPTPRPQL